MADKSEKSEPVPRRTNWPKRKVPAKKAAKPAAKTSTEKSTEKPPATPSKVVETKVLPPENKSTEKEGVEKAKMLPMQMMPTSDAAILNNLVSREVAAPSGPLEPPSPTVELLKKTVKAIAAGGDITPFKQELERITANMPEKADLVMAQLNQLNDERIPRLVELQDNAERVLVQASRRSDVAVSEALVTWKLANQELALILKSKADARATPVDGRSAVDKINLSQQKVDAETAKKWEYTSPQGREIIRKKLWELKRQKEAEAKAEKPAEPATTAKA